MLSDEKKPLRHYHENWWHVDSDFIWYLAGKATDDPYLPVAKWYFEDEAQALNGPYDSREAAEEALAAYTEAL